MNVLPGSVQWPTCPSPTARRGQRAAATGPGGRLICNVAARQTAEQRALDRFLRNRAKELGTLLPASPDAPQPDTAVLWAFLSKQLAAGISNEAQVIPRAAPSTAAAAAATGQDGDAHKAKGAGARRGVVIAQPEAFPDAQRTEPLPPALLALSRAPDPGSVPGSAPAGSTAGGGGGSPPADSAPPAQVHVFWDVGSAHPGDLDPRLAAAELLRLARTLGRPAGCYAYATRGAWAWVPSHFVEHYAQAGDGGGSSSSSSSSGGGRGGGSAAVVPGRQACPVCGQPMARSRLERHIKELHPGRLAAELAASAAAAAATAAAAAAGAAARGAAGGAAEGRDMVPRPPGGRLGKTNGGGGGGAGAAARTNSAQTGLGSVAAYYSSGGELYRPPAGHQLSLKYAVQREGFDPRVAQNADGASDRALNGGVDRLLAALRNGRARAVAAAVASGGVGVGDAGQGEITLVIASGSQRHGAALTGCRRLGVRTVLVAPGRAGSGATQAAVGGEEAGADAVLDWGLLASGAYML